MSAACWSGIIVGQLPIVIAALAVALNRAINWAEQVLIPWKPHAFT